MRPLNFGVFMWRLQRCLSWHVHKGLINWLKTVWVCFPCKFPVFCSVIVTWKQQSKLSLTISLSGCLWVAWVQLDYVRKTFFWHKMSHNAPCCPKSLNSFSAPSDGEGHDIRTGLADLGTEQRTAKWHDSCCGRILEGGNYTPKRSRVYITDHNEEMKKCRNHNGAQIKGIR